jgi:hypothetical protein
MNTYFARLIDGERAIGSSTEHYWRWPVMVRFRPLRKYGVWLGLRVSIHGIRDGVVRGRGPFRPAVRSLLWIGPVGLEFGWKRQAIEDWLWRRRLAATEKGAPRE